MLDIAYCIQTAIWTADCIDSTGNGSITDVRHAAIRRDDYTCQACGLHSSITELDMWCGLEVHHMDDNHDNNEDSNLVTVCPLCHGILHLDLMLQEGRMPGRFLWTDAIPQIQLNMITHVRAVAEILTAEMQADPSLPAAAIAQAMKLRDKCRNVCESIGRLGIPDGLAILHERKDGGRLIADNPALFGEVLGIFMRRNPTARERDAVAKHLRPLRWFYDWEADSRAKCYAASDVWNNGRQWYNEWAWLAQRVLDGLARQDLHP